MDVPETRYVRTHDGLHVGYQVFGSGPYDLVWNDTMANLDANWDLPSWAAVLRALGQRARVISFDRRGLGVSDRPASSDGMSLELGMEDLRAVLDAVGSERPVHMGFSWGCALSLLFAASYPDRTAGLALLAPAVYYWRTPEFPWGSVALGEPVPEEAPWGTDEHARAELDDLGVPHPDDAEVRAWAKWFRLVASPAAAALAVEAARQTDVRALLPQIQVPTLVLSKEGDRDRPSGGAAPWVAAQIPGARFVEVPGVESMPTARDTVLYDTVDRFARDIRDEEAEFDRVLATVLFTDIVGSTERAAALGDRAWRDLAERHHGVVRAMLARYRGTEVDTAGDGFFATFDGPARAIRSAQAIREAVRPLGIEVRAGCHTGEVETIDHKVAGLAVNIGSRVAALAAPSEILVSSTVKDLTAGSGLVFEDAGERELKGVPDRWRLYRVASSVSV
ncbi:MAG TPA: adenylate/guanylate cyclase domain-containing protein [Patescibacteria group bacterium]|nr:adenylate/guanylate cyclase domain-containing protein [Patescibacteria group bacterium]